MDVRQMDDAYHTQPIFHSLVDVMYINLMNGEISVYELRDACTYAINKFAQTKPPDSITIESQTMIFQPQWKKR